MYKDKQTGKQKMRRFEDYYFPFTRPFSERENSNFKSANIVLNVVVIK